MDKNMGFLIPRLFIVVEAMEALAKFAVEGPGPIGDGLLENWITLCEKVCDEVCGPVAVLLQLALLAWVDLAMIPPDKDPVSRWAFRLLRLSAHFVAFLIHIPLVALQPDRPMPPPNRRLRDLMLSILSIIAILVILRRFHFSQLYIMCSIIISSFAWLLYFVPVAKTYMLLCEPGKRGHRNVLGFDFFCRTLCFSLFWYVVYYDPTGTFKPEWADVLG
jgi:hypothetical protein